MKVFFAIADLISCRQSKRARSLVFLFLLCVGISIGITKKLECSYCALDCAWKNLK
jgi:hypothetical protein